MCSRALVSKGSAMATTTVSPMLRSSSTRYRIESTAGRRWATATSTQWFSRFAERDSPLLAESAPHGRLAGGAARHQHLAERAALGAMLPQPVAQARGDR